MNHTLPQEFTDKMNILLKGQANAFLASYEEERSAGLRINPLKVERSVWEEISPFSLEPIPFVINGYYYSFRKDEPGKHPYHAAGVYYIQEPSAMFVATLLDAKPGEKILDLCAAPGGKSTQIAGDMENSGLLISNEVYPKRAKILSENIERLGITNTVVTNETPERLSKVFPHYFDKILVDAPCSGEGMFRKDPEATQYWSQEHVEECQLLQKDILDHAYQMLKADGILVYSTCTFSPEENEQVIDHFINKYSDMELITIEKTNGISAGNPEWANNHNSKIEKTARLWPHSLRGEGHFAAKLRKKSTTPTISTVSNTKWAKSNQLQDFYQFQETYLQNIDFNNLVLMGTNLYSLPEDCPDLKGIKVVRSGLHLGELKKNRFEPNHALALAFHENQVKQVFQLDEHNWLRYLKGETLSGTGEYKGWVLVSYNHFPLSWGKESNGIIKNQYPKGLRIK